MIANDLVLSAVLNPSGSWNAHGPGVTSTAGGGPVPGAIMIAEVSPGSRTSAWRRVDWQTFHRTAGRAGPGPGAAARGRLRGAWGSRAGAGARVLGQPRETAREVAEQRRGNANAS